MIGMIENAILAALQAAAVSGQLGYEWRVLETFPDEFEEYLATRNVRAPGAWVVFLGMVDGRAEAGEDGWSGRARFALVVAGQNLRNEQDSRHGDGTRPGSYQLVIDAIRILNRNWLQDTGALDGGPVDLAEPIMVRGARPVARSEQMRLQNLSLFALDLECRLPVGEFAADLGDFAELAVDWDVPPLGNVAPPLPAETADARDLLELDQ